MFGHMHEVLNVDEKITNYTDCDKFLRQIFEPNQSMIWQCYATVNMC
jgi:hypothetical protein